MARHLSLSCDKCGKKEGPKTEIVPASLRREDGVRMTVDLCTACWSTLPKDYGFSEANKPTRKTFTVYDDVSDIGKL